MRDFLRLLGGIVKEILCTAQAEDCFRVKLRAGIGKGSAMVNYFALFYDELVEDFVNRRAPFREEHLRLARESFGRGQIQLAGALADPADGALLIFRAETAQVAEDFAKNDPYVRNGLVKGWHVRRWSVVIGNQ